METVNFYGIMRAYTNCPQSNGALCKDVLKDTSDMVGWESLCGFEFF